MESVFHQLPIIHLLANHRGTRGEPDRKIPCPHEDHSLFNWKEKWISSSSFLISPTHSLCFSQMKSNKTQVPEYILSVCTSVYFPALFSLLETRASATRLPGHLCSCHLPVPPTAHQSKCWRVLPPTSLLMDTFSFFQNDIFPLLSLPWSTNSIPGHYQMPLCL